MCKYIHKYIYKGENCVTVHFKGVHINEVAEHLNGYYIGPMQAAYQMLEYSSHKKDSLITVLSIHLLNEQPVYFLEDATVKEIQQVADQFSNTFMIFFKCCAENPNAWQYLYHKFPVHFVYDQKTKLYSWKPCQCGRAIAQMVHLSPIVDEKFYLCLLFTKIQRPQLFEQLHTVNGQLMPMF